MGEPGRTDVLLVDGVGRPRILSVPDALIPANVIEFAHPQRAKSEAQVIVKFDRQGIERDEDGRLIYRMRGTGTPRIRYEELFKVPILTTNDVRLTATDSKSTPRIRFESDMKRPEND